MPGVILPLSAYDHLYEMAPFKKLRTGIDETLQEATDCEGAKDRHAFQNGVQVAARNLPASTRFCKGWALMPLHREARMTAPG